MASWLVSNKKFKSLAPFRFEFKKLYMQCHQVDEKLNTAHENPIKRGSTQLPCSHPEFQFKRITNPGMWTGIGESFCYVGSNHNKD